MVAYNRDRTGIVYFFVEFFACSSSTGLPERLYLQTGEEIVLTTGLPITASIEVTSTQSEVSINGRDIKDIGGSIDLSEPFTIAACGAGEARISFKIAGMTIRNMTLLVDQDRVLTPGGQCIGVAMYTQGALVVSTADIVQGDGTSVNPGTMAGIREGDVIIAVNGERIRNADHLGELITNSRTDIHITVLRSDEEIELTAHPVEDSVDGKYRIGLWVRDSTAGIGTLTYTDPMNQSFAALGHAIADADTSENLLLKEGQIVGARVIDVIKGEDGVPGELCGMFVTSGKAIGKILMNSDEGLFGTLYQPVASTLYPAGVPVGWQNEVDVGSCDGSVHGGRTDRGGIRLRNRTDQPPNTGGGQGNGYPNKRSAAIAANQRHCAGDVGQPHHSKRETDRRRHPCAGK